MTNAGDLVAQYRGAAAAVIVALGLAVWPVALTPIAQRYARFCAHYLASLPFLPQLSPYAAVPLLAGLGAMALTAAVLLARQLAGQHRLAHAAAARRVPGLPVPASVLADLGLGWRVEVVQDRAAYAFCAGLAFPRVYVSTGLLALLTPLEIEAVLWHEARHLQHRDPLRLFVADLLQALLSPLPAIGTLFARVRIDIELAADQAALAVVPVEVLASALVKVARAEHRRAPSFAAAGLTPTAARIDALLGRPVEVRVDRRELIMTGLVLLVVLVVAVHLAALECPTVPACPACAVR